MNLEQELKKVREEAAKYRVQLAPYKQAFGHLDDDAINWMLNTVSMMKDNPQQAGLHFATLAYGNMGEDRFKLWAKSVVGEEEFEIEPEGSTTMDDTEFQQWAENFEAKIMSAIQNVQAQTREQIEEQVNRQEYEKITNMIRNLGYDPDSWQGKMLVDIAASEVEGNDYKSRLDAADVIARERLGTNAPNVNNPLNQPVDQSGQTLPDPSLPPLPEQQYKMVGGIQVPVSPEPTEVPPTGGNIGGGGVPNGAATEPSTFSQANDALLSLMRSTPG